MPAARTCNCGIANRFYMRGDQHRGTSWIAQIMLNAFLSVLLLAVRTVGVRQPLPTNTKLNAWRSSTLTPHCYRTWFTVSSCLGKSFALSFTIWWRLCRTLRTQSCFPWKFCECSTRAHAVRHFYLLDFDLMELFPNARNSCWPWISAEFSLQSVLDFLTKIVLFFFFSCVLHQNLFKNVFHRRQLHSKQLVSTMNTWEMLWFLVRLNIYQLHSLNRPVSMCVWLGCACATDCISDASRVGIDWCCTAVMESSNALFLQKEKKKEVCRCISHDAMMDVVCGVL